MKQSRKVVTVGSISDWPLGPRLVQLLNLPEAASRVACFQVVGHHGDEVAAEVSAMSAKMPLLLKEASAGIQAAIEVCTYQRAAHAGGFHGALSRDELAVLLSETYLVRSPAEAVLARTKTAAKSLAGISKALGSVDGLPKKRLLTWLEKGGKSIEIDEPDQLAKVFVSDPEAMNDVDRRLLSLWCRSVNAATKFFPTPAPGTPECGVDRRWLYVEALRAEGVALPVIERMLLTRWAEHIRFFPSTGVWVWEQLASDPLAFCQRVLAYENGAHRLVSVLSAVLELPQKALAAGAGDLMRRVCADRSLVPDETIEKLLKDPSYRSTLGELERSGAPATGKPFVGGTMVVVPLRDLTE